MNRDFSAINSRQSLDANALVTPFLDGLDALLVPDTPQFALAPLVQFDSPAGDSWELGEALVFSPISDEFASSDAAGDLVGASQTLLPTAAGDGLTNAGTDSADKVAVAVARARQSLQSWRGSGNFASGVQSVYGDGVDVAQATAELDTLLATPETMPNLEVVDNLGAAAGAYAAANDTIYLSQSWVSNPNQTVDDITRVILEELGHALDARLHETDTAGDEGALFAAEVTGQELSEAERAAIAVEDDSATVVIDRQELAIEQDELPDLVGVFADADNDYLIGGQTDFTFRIKNQGTEPVGTFSVDVRYSDDQRMGNGGELTLARVTIDGGLRVNETIERTVSLTLSSRLLNARAQGEEDHAGAPAGTADGFGDYIGIVIDPDNEISESDESNNAASSTSTLGQNLDKITHHPWDVNGDGQVSQADIDDLLFLAGQSVAYDDESVFGYPINYGYAVGAGLDFDGDNVITAADGDIIANYLGHFRDPGVLESEPSIPLEVTLALSNDTGDSTSDRVTSDPTISGQLSNSTDITALQVRLGKSGVYIDILDRLEPDGSFTLTLDLLKDLNGGSLPANGYAVDVVAQNSSGAIDFSTLFFRYDAPQDAVGDSGEPLEISLVLSNDTGDSDSDGLTADPSVSGQLSDADNIAFLQARIGDGQYIDISDALQTDGTFTLDTARLTQLNGGTLPEGQYVVDIQAQNVAGTVGTNTLEFTYELPPIEPPDASMDALMLTSGESHVVADNAAIKARLEQLGYTVTTHSSSGFQREDADGMELIVGTGYNGPNKSEVNDLDIPVLIINQRLLDEFDLVAAPTSTVGSFETILENTAHPIAEGIAPGNFSLYTDSVSPSKAQVGLIQPGANAQNIVTTNWFGRSSIFAHETGDSLFNGQVASARRVTFVGLIREIANLSDTGWQLFDNSVNWLVGSEDGQASPGIVLALSNDTGDDDSDRITTDPRISGQLSNVDNIASLQARIGNGNYIDISDALQADGTFTLDTARLTQLNGGMLPEGQYVVDIQVQNVAGTVGTTSIDFTYELPPIEPPDALLLTAANALNSAEQAVSDRLSDLGFTVTTERASNFERQDAENAELLVAAAWSGLDAGEVNDLEVPVIALGRGLYDEFQLVPDQDGLWLEDNATVTIEADGHLIADGIDGEVTLFNTVQQRRDARPHASATQIVSGANGYSSLFAYDVGDALAGDDIAEARMVAFLGSIDSMSSLSTAGWQLFDNAVNWAVGSDEPVELSLTLSNNTGASNTDAISWDPTIAGQLTNAEALISLQARVGDGEYVDIVDTLQTDGSFTLDEARLAQLNGGELAYGEQTLEVRAQTATGAFDTLAFTFTYDQSPDAAPDALLLTLDTALNSAEQAVSDRLSDSGFTVITELASNFERQDADYAELVVAAAWYGLDATQVEDLEVPVIALGRGLYDEFQLVPDQDGLWLEDNATVTIEADSHPIVNGLDGEVTLFNTAQQRRDARPHASATQIISGANGYSSLFAYDVGDALAGNDVADARMVAFLGSIDSMTNLSTAGWQLFDNAVNWAIDEPLEISLALSNDTGDSDSDRLTIDPTVSGQLSDTRYITSLQARIGSGSYIDISDVLQTDGTFTLDTARLTQLNGGSLPEGQYVVEIQAQTVTGTVGTTTLDFTYDLPSIDLALALSNDTGNSDSDGLTADPSVSGQLSEADNITLLQARMGSGQYVDISDTLQTDGTFNLDLERLGDINGGSLPYGDYTVEILAQTASGATDSTTVDFSYEFQQAALPYSEGEFVPLELTAGETTFQFGLPENVANDDQLLVYLLNENDPTDTLLSTGAEGNPLLSGTSRYLSYDPGLVSVADQMVTVDVSTLTSEEIDSAAAYFLIFSTIESPAGEYDFFRSVYGSSGGGGGGGGRRGISRFEYAAPSPGGASVGSGGDSTPDDSGSGRNGGSNDPEPQPPERQFLTRLGDGDFSVSYGLLNEADSFTKPTEIKFGSNVLTLNYSDTGVFEGSSNDELLDVVLASVGLTSLDALAAGEITASTTQSLLPSAQTLELQDVWSRIEDIAIKPNKDYDQLTQDKQLELLDFQENLIAEIELLDGFVSHKDDKDLLATTNQIGVDLLNNENSLLSFADLYSAGEVNYDALSLMAVSKTLAKNPTIEPNSELAWLAAITYSEAMTAKSNGESFDMYVFANKILSQAKIIESSNDDTLSQKYGYPVDGSLIKGVISSFNAEQARYSSYEGAFYDEFILGLQVGFDATNKVDAEASIEAAAFTSVLANYDSSIVANSAYEDWIDRPNYDVVYAGIDEPFIDLSDYGEYDNDLVDIYQDGERITESVQAPGYVSPFVITSKRINLRPLKPGGSEIVIRAVSEGTRSPATIQIDIPNAIYGPKRYQRDLYVNPGEGQIKEIKFTMGVPQININGAQAPEAATHVRDILGKPTRFTLDRKDRFGIVKRRRDAARQSFQRENGDDPISYFTGFQLDEVPFASVKEGGGTAYVRPIPGIDNGLAGNSFEDQINRYGPNNVPLKDDVVIDVWTTTIVGAKSISVAPDDNNRLLGTSDDDYLYGRDRISRYRLGEVGSTSINLSDQIDGAGGNDIIFGGQGDDTINGGSGDDIIFGQEGNDLIIGLSGSDTIIGGFGEDDLWGGTDADSFVLDIRNNYNSDTIYDFDIYDDKLLFQRSNDQVSDTSQLIAERYVDTQGDEGIKILFNNGTTIRPIAFLDGTYGKDTLGRPTVDNLNARGGIASIVSLYSKGRS